MLKSFSGDRQPQLRVVYGDSDVSDERQAERVLDLAELDSHRTGRVAVGAGEVFELLQDAISSNRAWLQDFADETIEVPEDLYEVLVAYRRLVYRRAA